MFEFVYAFLQTILLLFERLDVPLILFCRLAWTKKQNEEQNPKPNGVVVTVAHTDLA